MEADSSSARVERSEALRREGNVLYEQGEAEGAVEAYRAAVGVLPGESEALSPAERSALGQALVNLAAAELRVGAHAAAEASATAALEVEGPTLAALYRRAVARRLLGELELAYEDLQRAASASSEAGAARLVREELAKLQQAALAAQPEGRLEALAEEHGLSEAETAELAAAASEPFYRRSASDDRLDVEALRAEVPSDALYFGPTEVVATTTVAPRAAGDFLEPYALDVAIAGGEFYREPLVFRLVFGPRYPAAPPKVRCVSLAQHAAFVGPEGSHDAHHSRRATIDFYAALLSDSAASPRRYSVAATIRCVRRALEEPLGRGWAQLARKHKERQLVIDAFASRRAHAAPELYPPTDRAVLDCLAPRLRDALDTGASVKPLCETVTEGVFAFDLFSETFAKRLLAEIDCFYASGLPAHRPNSMNNYGVIVNDIGLEPFVTALQRLVLQPIAAELFAAEPHPGAHFDGHHAFIVKYRADEDSHLDIHTDDSDVTFNTCLGRDFDGCGLVFCGMIGTPEHRQHTVTYRHAIARCVVHLGNRRHGADHITRGERLNLIVWNHGLAWRDSPAASRHNRDYQPEAIPPDPRCVSYTHDRDFANFKSYPADRTHFKGRGWCPPPGAEYPGFQPELP